MRRTIQLLLALMAVSAAAFAEPVWVGLDSRSIVVDPAADLWPIVEGKARYQGPEFTEDEPNWSERRTYAGVPIPAILEKLGGMSEDDPLYVIAGDGYAKEFPRDVVMGESPLGTPILAWKVDGSPSPDWPPLPVLIFLPEDGDVSNERMVEALGPLAHMFGDRPSASGLRIRGVSWLTPNWDGRLASLPEHPDLMPADEYELTVTAREERVFTLNELMITVPSVRGTGTYITAAGRQETAHYEGFPVQALIGEWPDDARVDVVAEDGYRITYSFEELADGNGQWILAFREGNAYIGAEAGPLRMVRVGPDAPGFAAARSPRAVNRIEVQATSAD